MRLSLMTRYRPTKTSDGSGGSTYSLASGVDVWFAVELHGAEVVGTSRSEEDIDPEDIVVNPEDSSRYRIMGKFGAVGAPYTRFQMERTKHPIVKP